MAYDQVVLSIPALMTTHYADYLELGLQELGPDPNATYPPYRLVRLPPGWTHVRGRVAGQGEIRDQRGLARLRYEEDSGRSTVLNVGREAAAGLFKQAGDLTDVSLLDDREIWLQVTERLVGIRFSLLTEAEQDELASELEHMAEHFDGEYSEYGERARFWLEAMRRILAVRDADKAKQTT